MTCRQWWVLLGDGYPHMALWLRQFKPRQPVNSPGRPCMTGTDNASFWSCMQVAANMVQCHLEGPVLAGRALTRG
jgi:hypothetical protein